VPKILGFIAAAVLAITPALAGAEGKVPAGKETLTLDSMSKAKQAMTPPKKVLKGPVPFAHQAHVDKGVACTDCHHKEKAGETPKPCSTCHKDTKGDAPKINDAFHGGEVESLPSLQSCIGCHARTVAGKKATNAPIRRDPCDACHSILKK
jgi:cytochrome c peroxidase